jgi:hypothetical protein
MSDGRAIAGSTPTLAREDVLAYVAMTRRAPQYCAAASGLFVGDAAFTSDPISSSY